MKRAEFHQLYRDYGPAVRARCRAICGNEADADEALQESFVRAWKTRDRFDGRYPLAWLQTIARNTSVDLLRRRRPWRDDPQVWLTQAAPERGDLGSHMDAVRLLDRFSPEDAALLRLRHAESWRIHEIAEHFETSQRTVRRRLERLERRASAFLNMPKEASHAP